MNNDICDNMKEKREEKFYIRHMGNYKELIWGSNLHIILIKMKMLL